MDTLVCYACEVFPSKVLIYYFPKGDVWDVQPAPKDHPWRTAKNPLGAGNGMVPHYSGTTLDAQKRYADGCRSILQNYFSDSPQDPQNVIVGIGKYESKACEYCFTNKRDRAHSFFKTVNAEDVLLIFRKM